MQNDLFAKIFKEKAKGVMYIIPEEGQSSMTDIPEASKRATPPAFLTTKEVAELMRQHPQTVRRKARQHRIPASKFGGQYRYPAAQILEIFATP